MPTLDPIVIAVMRARFTAIAGPAVVESGTTTVLLLPGDRATMNGHGVLDIAIGR